MERETRIKEFWSGQMMTVLYKALDNKINLPEATVDFLTDIGLPTVPIRGEKNVYFTPNQTAVVTLNGTRYLQIGYMNAKEMLHMQPICIREGTGEVYLDNSAYIDFDTEGLEEAVVVPLYYMNQDIQSLLLYYIAFRENLLPMAEIFKHYIELKRLDNPSRSQVRKTYKAIDAKKQEIASSLDAELREIDASALAMPADKTILPYWLEEYLDLRVRLR